MSDDFSQGPFGFGPFPELGEILDPEPTPLMSGFGGVEPDSVGSGAPYGLGSYGSAETPTENIPITGGFGGSEYGFNPYGNISPGNGGVLQVYSLDGFTIRVVFDGQAIDNDALTTTSNYTISPVLGADCTVEGVTPGPVVDGGVEYVDLEHSGTTWGGLYLATIGNLHTSEGDPITATVSVLTLGEAPSYTVTPHVDGRGVRLTFSRPLLPVVDEVDSATGSTSTGSYAIRPDNYPVTPTVDSVSRVSDLLIDLLTTGQTSTTYNAVVAPSLFVDYDPAEDEDLPDLLGTGTATRTANTLNLTRAAGSSDFGAVFYDATGDFLDGSTFATFVKIQPGTTSPTPTSGSAASFWVVDDTYQIRVSLEYGLTPFLRVDGGGYTADLDFDWTGAVSFELGVLRNQKAGIYSFLVDGYPLASAALGTVDDPAAFLIAPGVAFVLDGGSWSSSNWRVHYTTATVTSTVYSAAWNFYHEVLTPFTGSGAFALSTLQTQHGPLVRPWGDGRPARVEDVHVYLDGNEVEVSEVNPYIGRITLTTPIPRMPPGTLEVTTDYTWQCSPTFPLVAGVEGSIAGGQSGVYDFIHIDDEVFEGSSEQPRFPLFVVSGDDGTLPQPVQTAHRFLAWERAYSALAGDPLTLNAGQLDFSVSVPEIQAPQASQNGRFDGTLGSTPVDQGWTLTGSDSGLFVSPLYGVGDALADAYSATSPPFALYSRMVDAGVDGAFYAAIKFQAPSSGERDGVFTGAAWGYHNGVRALVVGLIVEDGHLILAYLVDPSNPGALESWSPVGSRTATATSPTTLVLSGEGTPTGLRVGDTILILDGDQAGTYTLTGATSRVCCGVTEAILEIHPPLPYRVDTQQGATPTVVIPQRNATDPVIVQIAGRSNLSGATVALGGAQYGTELSLSASDLPTPVQWGLNLPAAPSLFFGALSKQGTASFAVESVQYTTTPDKVFRTGRGVVVEWLAGELPENNSPALHPSGLGGRVGLDFFNDLVLEQLSQERSVGYFRPEPFLRRSSKIEVRTTLTLESPGVNGGFLRFGNDTASVRLAALTLDEVGGIRRLVQVPRTSFDGLLSPEAQGWVGTGGTRYEGTLTLAGGELYASSLSGGQHYTSPGGLRCVWDMEVVGATAPGEIGSLEWSGRKAVVSLLAPNILRLSDPSASFTQDYTLAWSGTGRHQITVRADETGNAVTLLIDDTLASPTLAASSFNGGVGGYDVAFGCGNAGSAVKWYFVQATALEPTGSIRTLGVAKLGDITDLDNWEIPRTDSSVAPNSALSGPVIQEMDWSTQIQLRCILDPSWGVSVLRPDLALPPYYVSGQGSPDSGFVNSTQEPSAAWINVEMAELQVESRVFGDAGFFADGSKLRLHAYNHRVFDHTNNDYRASQHQVAGYGNLIDAGDVARHRQPIFLDIPVASPATILVSATDIYASAVFTLGDGATVYHQDAFDFDVQTQVVTLLDLEDGTPRTFASDVVTVQLRPSKTLLTRTLLEALPAWSGNNLLFEGTPAYFADHGIGVEVSEWVSPDLEDPDALPPANALNPPLADPYKTLLVEGKGTLSFTERVMSTNDGVDGVLQSFCDGCDGVGVLLELEGQFFSEVLSPPQDLWEDSNPPNPFGGSGSFLIASGGSFMAPTFDLSGDPDGGWMALGGLVGPGGAILTPLGAGSGSSMALDLYGVYTDGASVDLEETVTTPTEEASVELAFPTAASMVGPYTGTLFYGLERAGAEVRLMVNTPIIGDTVTITLDGVPTVFTAAAVRSAPTDFVIAVDAAEALAASIREVLGDSGFLATKETLPAHPYPVVLIRYLNQIDVFDQTSIVTSSTARLNALGVRTEADGMFISSRSGLQGSVLAGGYSGLDFGGGFDSSICFVAEGGRALPDDVSWITL